MLTKKIAAITSAILALIPSVSTAEAMKVTTDNYSYYLYLQKGLPEITIWQRLQPLAPILLWVIAGVIVSAVYHAMKEDKNDGKTPNDQGRKD